MNRSPREGALSRMRCPSGWELHRDWQKKDVTTGKSQWFTAFKVSTVHQFIAVLYTVHRCIIHSSSLYYTQFIAVLYTVHRCIIHNSLVHHTQFIAVLYTIHQFIAVLFTVHKCSIHSSSLYYNGVVINKASGFYECRHHTWFGLSRQSIRIESLISTVRQKQHMLLAA
jgi:hypothetical protein